MLTEGIKADSKFYDIIVDQLSHPAAIFRLGFVDGTRQMQKRLNLLIILNKIPYLICIILILMALAKILPYYFLIIIPIIILIAYLTINPFQTITNIELYARLSLLDETTEKKDKSVKIKFEDK